MIMFPFTPGKNHLNVPEEIVLISSTSSFVFSVLFTPDLVTDSVAEDLLESDLNPVFHMWATRNGLYSNFLITFSIILYTNFTSLKYIMREIKSTDKAKPLLISFHHSKFLQSKAGYVEANAILIYFNGNSGFSDCG